jgi:hypothetical protein
MSDIPSSKVHRIEIKIPDHKNPLLYIEHSLSDIIQRRTLEEKVAQMICNRQVINTIYFNKDKKLKNNLAEVI